MNLQNVTLTFLCLTFLGLDISFSQTTINSSTATVKRSTSTVVYEEPKLAVATLVNIDATAEDNWIGIGLEEIFQSRLVQLKGIKLVEKKDLQKAINALPYQPRSEEITQDVISLRAAKTIKIKYLVTGSFRSRKNSLSLKVNLVDAVTDKNLGTISMERDPKYISEIEKSIVCFLVQKIDQQTPVFGIEEIYASFEPQNCPVKPVTTTLMVPPQKSIEYYLMMISMEPDNPDIYYNLGNALLDLKEFEQADMNYKIALKLYAKKYDKWGVSQVYYKFGEMYHQQKDYPQAGRYYQLSAAIKTQLKDYFGLIFVLGALSNLSENHAKIDEAIYWEMEAYKVKEKVKNPSGQIDSMKKVAIFYEKQENYKKALQYAKQAESLVKKNKYQVTRDLDELIFRLRTSKQ